MTWDNYGPYWHLDHRIPRSWFNDSQFNECWKLDNLQPKVATENLIKGNRYIG